MSLRPAIRSPLVRAGRSPMQRSAGGAGGPTLEQKVAALFSAGEQGVWFDPSDMSTMFQDTAGTVPAAVGQSVARINDKSGRGNFAIQATVAKRPTLQTESGRQFLLFDATDDCLLTSAMNMTVTNKATVWAGVRKLSDAAVATVFEHGVPGADSQCLSFQAPGSPAANFVILMRGGGVSDAATMAPYAAPFTAVISVQLEYGAATPALRIRSRANGVSGSTTGAAAPTGTFGNYVLFVGARNNAAVNLMNGRLYSLIIRGAASTAQQITDGEAYVASKTGIVLP